jgi:AAA domain/TrwC relaxase
LFEIDGVPEAVLRQFSQRRVEIEERAAELAGVAAGGLSRERMQGVALATRRPKDSRVAQAGWREQARARAAEHGFGKFEMADLVRRPERLSPELDLGVVVSRLSGSSGLTEMHNTFARRHALAEVAGAFPGGGTVAAVEAATVRYLADPSVRELDAAIGHEARFTTESLLMCERAIVDGAERRRNEQTATLPADAVARAIDRHQPVLNDGQAAAIHALTRAGHGVEVVSALAGTGKTAMIAALAQAYQDQGYRVIGTAPTARAARELRSAAGVPAGTMHALLAELDRTGQFSERTVLVIDEAGMAPTRPAAAILAHAERSRTKIIAVGDPGQLASVQAGGWLGALDDRHPGPRLRAVIRQQDPAERAALEALHDGHPEVYLDHKQGAITVHAEEQQAVEALVDEWDAARQEHGRPTQ